MADAVKTEMGYDEWCELLKPYGWADITTRSPARRIHSPLRIYDIEIRVMLAPAPAGQHGEWEERSYLLEQARQCVQAVQAKGHELQDAPRIEFGGRYMYQAGNSAPAWVAQAELHFTVPG